MKTALVRPNITFFSLPKMLIMSMFVSFTLGALAWLWTKSLGFGYPKNTGFFVGAIWFVLACWNWWSWRPMRRNAQWHRWISGLAYVIYASGYFWLAGTSFWASTLPGVWKLVVVGTLVASFTLAFVCPILCPRLAQRLYKLHGTIDRNILIWIIVLIGLSGVSFWFEEVLEQEYWIIFTSILGPILGLGFLQFHSFEIWQTCPWMKEDR